jgi:hypothetical protein
MLRGWPIALVAAMGASALFAFGVVQSAFAPQAQALFLVFAAVLALFVLFGAMFGARRAKHGHEDRAVKLSGSLVGMLTVIAGVLAVVYFWTDNQLSAEKIGREIDRSAASLGQQAQTTFERLSGQRDDTLAES